MTATITIRNSSKPLLDAIADLVRQYRGASVAIDESGDEEDFSDETVNSVLADSREMEEQRKNGTLRLFSSVDEMFGDL